MNTPTPKEMIENTVAHIKYGFDKMTTEELRSVITRLHDATVEACEKAVPEDGENEHSVYTRCHDCLTWGINMPNEIICGNCLSTNTSEYWPDCRQQTLQSLSALRINPLTER